MKEKIAYLFLIFFLFILFQKGFSEEKHFWAVCIDENNGYKFGDGIKKALISNGWRENHIKVIRGGSAEDIFNALKWLKNVSRNDDIVLFYFSGHGYNGGIEAGNEKISYIDLNEKLNKIKCNGMAIFIDACHSGSAIPFLEKNGRVIITSCGVHETSGYFSDALINAFSIASDCNGNLDKRVSAEEIFSYIKSDWYMDYTPQMKDEYKGNLILLYLPEEKRVSIYQIHAQRIVENFGRMKLLRQSFVPLSKSIDGISLKIAKWKNATDAYLEIYDENLSFIGKYTIHADEVNDINNISTWIFVNIDINVTPNKKYFFVLKSNSTWWLWGSNNWYKNGEACVSFDDGITWNNISNDFGFIIYTKRDNYPPKIFLNCPDGTISGNATISWIARDNYDRNLNGSIDIFYSNDGNTWHIIATGLESNGKYEWKAKDGIYIIKAIAFDESGNRGENISNCFIVDNTPPNISFLFPEKNSFYIENRKIMSLENTILIGKKEIIIDAIDEIGINKVEFFLDGNKVLTLNNPPYEWLWKKSFGKHEIMAKAYDNAGNYAQVKQIIAILS